MKFTLAFALLCVASLGGDLYAADKKEAPPPSTTTKQSEAKKPAAVPALPPGVKNVKLTAITTKDGPLTAHERALEMENLALRMANIRKDADAKLNNDLRPFITRQEELMVGLDVPKEAVVQINAKKNELYYQAAQPEPVAAKPEEKKAEAPAAKPPETKVAEKR